MAYYGGDVVVLILASLLCPCQLVFKEQTKCNTKIEPNCNVAGHWNLANIFSFRMLIVSLYQGNIVRNIFTILLQKESKQQQQRKIISILRLAFLHNSLASKYSGAWLNDTRLIRTPIYNGQLRLSQRKADICPLESADAI